MQVSVVLGALWKGGESFDFLRPIPESEWTEADAIVVARSDQRGDELPMQLIPAKLKTRQVWLSAFVKNPQWYESDIPDDIATYDFYLEACLQKPSLHKYVPTELYTTQLALTCIQKIKYDGHRHMIDLDGFLKFVPAECQTSEMIERLTTYQQSNFEYVANQSVELCKAVLAKQPHVISEIREQTPELCVFAIESAMNKSTRYDVYSGVIRAIRTQDERFYIHVLERLGRKCAFEFLRYSPVQTKAICLAAYDLDNVCVNVIRSLDIRRWLMRTVIARKALPLLKVGLSASLLTEVYGPLQEVFFPVERCFSERKLSPLHLWNLLVCVKRFEH